MSTYPGGPTTSTTWVLETLGRLRKVARRSESPGTEEPIELIELSKVGVFDSTEEILELAPSVATALLIDSLRDETESLLSS